MAEICEKNTPKERTILKRSERSRVSIGVSMRFWLNINLWIYRVKPHKVRKGKVLHNELLLRKYDLKNL